MPMLGQPHASLLTSVVWGDCGENVGNASLSSYIISGNFPFRSIWGRRSPTGCYYLNSPIRPGCGFTVRRWGYDSPVKVQGSFMACQGVVPWFGDVTADVVICPYTGNLFLEVFKDAAGPG